MPHPDGRPTDAELDARAAALSDDDLQQIASGRRSDLLWYRPAITEVFMATEILSLRKRVAELEANNA